MKRGKFVNPEITSKTPRGCKPFVKIWIPKKINLGPLCIAEGKRIERNGMRLDIRTGSRLEKSAESVHQFFNLGSIKPRPPTADTKIE